MELKYYLWQEILAYLYKKTCIYEHEGYFHVASIVKKLDSTVCHISRVTSELRRRGLLNKEKSRHISYISLTEKGKRLGRNLWETKGVV